MEIQKANGRKKALNPICLLSVAKLAKKTKKTKKTKFTSITRFAKEKQCYQKMILICQCCQKKLTELLLF